MKLVSSDRRRPRSLNAAAAEIAAAVFVHVSFWLLLSSMLGLHLTPLAITGFALLPVFWYLLARIQGFGRLVPVYAVVVPALIFLVTIKTKFFTGGFTQLYDYFSKTFNEVHGLTFFPSAAGYPEAVLGSGKAQGALLLVGLLFSAFLSYAICRKVKTMAVLATMLPALLGFVTGLRPSRGAFIFYLVAVTFYLILLATRSKGTARRLTWLNGEISAALLVFLVLLSLLLSGFERSEQVEALRQKIAQNITSFRYAPEDSTDGMPGGDLTQADTVTYEEKTVLQVETPNAFSMYFRGFSGDVYKDGAWGPLPDKAYFQQYDLVSPWVRSRYFSPAISVGQLMDLKWEVQSTQYENGDRKAINMARYPITVRNQLAFRDKLYVPYEVSGDSKGLRRADLSHEGIFAEGLRGQKEYELTVYQPLTGDYGNVSSKSLLGEDTPLNSFYRDYFDPAEQAYRSFVKSQELQIPKAYRDTIEQLSRSVVGSPKKQSDAVFRIRNYFSKNFRYSLEVEAPKTGTDPLLQFLTETRTGYDTHFASLAVLLFRGAGIPARYAEGYYLSEELAAGFEKETDVVIDIPDSASHAWVELYKDGVGWVPVEMTPGYYESEGSSTAAGAGSTTTEAAAPEEVPQEVPEDASKEDGPSEGGEGAGAEDTNVEDRSGRSSALLALPILLLLLLVPLLWNTRERRTIAAAADAKTTGKAYRYLLRVLRAYGVRIPEDKPKNLLPLLGEAEASGKAALQLLLKETFSEEGLQTKERKAFCDYVLDVTADHKLLRRIRTAYKEQEKGERPNGK